MITDSRINAKGELEGKVIPPTKWEEMYTKDDIVDMLTELKEEIEEIEKFTNTVGWELRAKTPEEIKKECLEIIQQKINDMREHK